MGISLTENPRVGGSIPPLGTFLDTTTPDVLQAYCRAYGTPKVLNTSEDARILRMSIFEADEYLMGNVPRSRAMADGILRSETVRSRWKRMR
jgi:hypothetical protein